MRLPDIRDDSPGFSDHPEADIKTHRQLAKGGRLIAALLFFTGSYLATKPEYSPELAITSGTAFAAIAYASANGLSMQALRWELQLEREGGDA